MISAQIEPLPAASFVAGTDSGAGATSAAGVVDAFAAAGTEIVSSEVLGRHTIRVVADHPFEGCLHGRFGLCQTDLLGELRLAFVGADLHLEHLVEVTVGESSAARPRLRTRSLRRSEGDGRGIRTSVFIGAHVVHVITRGISASRTMRYSSFSSGSAIPVHATCCPKAVAAIRIARTDRRLRICFCMFVRLYICANIRFFMDKSLYSHDDSHLAHNCHPQSGATGSSKRWSRSCGRTSRPGSGECVVVNNNSVDDTRERFAAFCRALSGTEPPDGL